MSATATSICVQCGDPFEHQANRHAHRYCSDPCKWAANKARRPVRTATCATCGDAFTTNEPRQRHCTRSCGRFGKPGPVPFACPACGELRTAIGCAACSQSRHAMARDLRSKARDLERTRQRIERIATVIERGDAECPECHVRFLRDWPQRRFCDKACAKRYRRRGRRTRGAEAIRRANRHAWERKWRRVVVQHGTTCHLCGGAIDMALRAPNPMSRSVDHVVPVAAGGTNDLSNLRLAHLGCNVVKSDRPLAEVLPLFRRLSA